MHPPMQLPNNYGRSAWAGLNYYGASMLLQCMYNNQKRTETSLHKKISKRNLADVGM